MVDKLQEFDYLLDQSASGKVRNWKDYKMKNELLSIAYETVNPHKAERLRGCSDTLVFTCLPGGTKKLKSANFCRVRLCPICTWRRSLQIFAQMRKIMLYLRQNYDYNYIFLTLTDKNCKKEDLSSKIDDMFAAYNLLTKRTTFRALSKGYFRSMEITHDTAEYITRDMWNGNKEKHIYSRKDYYKKHGLKIGDKNPNFDNYHVHFHTIIAVNKSYFKDPKIYLTHEKWSELWRGCLGVDYTPIVDVRKIKGNTVQAICETAKYTVKADDYIVPDDWDLTVDTVAVLDKALDRRRLVAYGGVFRDAHKKLDLSDINSDTSDLINLDDSLEEQGEKKELVYFWDSGFKNYLKEY